MGSSEEICLDTALQRAGSASCSHEEGNILLFGGRKDDLYFKDCWEYRPEVGTFFFVGEAPRTFSPRAHHTATVINGSVWLIGGMDQQNVIKDFWCFDILKQRWRQPRLKGVNSLLCRCAHAACAHPGKPGSILIFGGYTKEKEKGIWLNDLIEIDTEKNVVREIDSGGSKPAPRGYHSFTRMGNFCISAFGRGANKTLIPRSKCLAILDTLSMTWTETSGDGSVPFVRSSHRATAFDEFLLVFGGIPDSRESKERLNIISILRCDGGSFFWKDLENSESLRCIPGRSAHCQEKYKDTLLIIRGYTKSPPYADDLVKLRFVKTKSCLGCRDVFVEFPALLSSYIPESELCSAEVQHSNKRQNEILHEDYFKRDSQRKKVERNTIKLDKTNAKKDSNVDWEAEANIADKKWKEAAARCLQLEILAEENKSNADAAFQRQIILEKTLSGMNDALNDMIDQIRVDCGGHESLPNVSRSITQTQSLNVLVQYLLQKKKSLTNSCTAMEITIGEKLKEIEELRVQIHQENELRADCLNQIDSYKRKAEILASDFKKSMNQVELALTASNATLLSREREIESLKMENRTLQSQLLEQERRISHLRSSHQEIEKIYQAEKEQTQQLSQKWLKLKEEITKSLDEIMR